jgi:tetratricopeptide (TPR) repeat protein
MGFESTEKSPAADGGGSLVGTVASSNGTKTSAKFDVSIDTLMKGCVNAFVQIFALSHRDPVCVDELAQTYFSIPDSRLHWIQEYLMSVELKRRKSDFRGALDDSLKLAQYFEEVRDFEQAAKHHRIALTHCADSLNRQLEGEAHEAFGFFLERRKNIAEAILHHETRLRLAEVSGDTQAKAVACRNLVRVYLLRGEEHQATQQMSDAKQQFEKAVTVAKSCGDAASEAQAYSALGNITVLLGDLQKALDYQKRFLVVSREAKSVHGESAASLKVAQLQEQLGQTSDAIASLKAALTLAEQSDDLRSICEACHQLGKTYKTSGESMKSVHYFREAFRVARDIGDAQLVNTSRVALGFALGEHYFASASGNKGFVSVVCNDMPAQLEWLGGGVL